MNGRRRNKKREAFRNEGFPVIVKDVKVSKNPFLSTFDM